MNRRHPSGPRAAFTLVELLVAMALIIFIMYILAEAFAAGTTAFRNLKAIGDMNERLRSATTTLRRYLQADHFDGRRRLSEPTFWNTGQYQPNGQPVFGSPQEGFLRIVQSGISGSEGNDLDNLPSFQSQTQALHFTVKLRGNNRGDYFRATVPNSTNPPNVSPLLSLPFFDSRFQDASAASPNGTALVCSPAAEVAFFLRDSGVTTDDPDSTTGNVQAKLYTLYFRQRLLVPDNGLLATTPYGLANTPNFPNNWLNYLEVSAIQDPTSPANAPTMYFNNLQDLTMPARRWGNFTLNSNTGLINAGNLPDVSSTSPTNFISGDGNLFVFSGNPPNATRNAVYPRLADDDPNSLSLTGISPAGNDVLLTDVLSCETEVLVDASAYQQYQTSFNGNQPIGVVPPTGQVTANPAPAGSTPPSVGFIDLGSDILTPYMANPASIPRLFDTWSNRKDNFYDYTNSPPPMLTFNHPNNKNHPLNGTKIRIRAIKISLRIWDSRTKQTRMTSVVVDL